MARLSPERLVFTSPFGPRAPNQAIGITEDMHWGADYGPDVRNKKGVPLQSIIDGTVTPLSDQYGALGVRTTTTAGGALLATLRRLYGTVREGASVSVSLWHLASRTKLLSARVAEGAVIGVMGSTGRSTGVHVHVELRIDGRLVDPKPFIDAQASKAVAPAPTDYYEEDDVALTDREKNTLEELWKRMPALDELLDRRKRIDQTFEHAKAADEQSKPLADRVGLIDDMAGQQQQVFARRGLLDTMSARVAAIHAALPELQQARDVGLDADEVQSLAAALAAALPKQDAQSFIDALAKQLAKP